jgi:hypothetical protein
MESTFMPWLMATMDSARAADPTMHWNRRIELQDVPRFVYAGEPVSAGRLQHSRRLARWWDSACCSCSRVWWDSAATT